MWRQLLVRKLANRVPQLYNVDEARDAKMRLVGGASSKAKHKAVHKTQQHEYYSEGDSSKSRSGSGNINNKKGTASNQTHFNLLAAETCSVHHCTTRRRRCLRGSAGGETDVRTATS